MPTLTRLCNIPVLAESPRQRFLSSMSSCSKLPAALVYCAHHIALTGQPRACIMRHLGSCCLQRLYAHGHLCHIYASRAGTEQCACRLLHVVRTRVTTHVLRALLLMLSKLCVSGPNQHAARGFV